MILIILDGKSNFMFPSLMYINYCLLAHFILMIKKYIFKWSLMKLNKNRSFDEIR